MPLVAAASSRSAELLKPFKEIVAEVNKGLDKVELFPVGKGYLDVTVGASQQLGAFGRIEGGAHPLDGLAVFGYAQASTIAGAEAGAGMRWRF